MSKSNLKAYVRYDGSGRVVPGGNILNRFKPKVGNWKETNSSLCCNGIPAFCYTVTIPAEGNTSATITWKDGLGDDRLLNVLIDSTNFQSSICAQEGSISVTTFNDKDPGGPYSISPAGDPCSGPTCVPCVCYTIDYGEIESLKYTLCNGTVVNANTKGTFVIRDCIQQGSIEYTLGFGAEAYINITGGTTPCTTGDDCI